MPSERVGVVITFVIYSPSGSANYSRDVTLSSMVVSRDWSEVSVLECILGGLHVRVDVEPELERVSAKLAKSKIDALIVDCDLDGTTKLLGGLKQELNTVPLLIIGSPSRCRELKASPATFTFEKPISVEQAVRKLSAARNFIMNGRLRYHRHPVDLPASVSYGRGKRVMADILNLSQGGVAIRTKPGVNLPTAVRVAFALPESKLKVRAKGKVIWKRDELAGIHFMGMSSRQTRDLQLWLAKQYLTN
ncbi:MAG TPA: PilZ domain-containing protein [Terriglobales bacterium]|nr:PilZ domain-containing protein [Terriglobales bacterium]